MFAIYYWMKKHEKVPQVKPTNTKYHPFDVWKPQSKNEGIKCPPVSPPWWPSPHQCVWPSCLGSRSAPLLKSAGTPCSPQWLHLLLNLHLLASTWWTWTPPRTQFWGPACLKVTQVLWLFIDTSVTLTSVMMMLSSASLSSARLICILTPNFGAK